MFIFSYPVSYLVPLITRKRCSCCEVEQLFSSVPEPMRSILIIGLCLIVIFVMWVTLKLIIHYLLY